VHEFAFMRGVPPSADLLDLSQNARCAVHRSVGSSDRRVDDRVLEIKMQQEPDAVNLRFVRASMRRSGNAFGRAREASAGQGCPCPPAVEADELGAVAVEDSRHKIPPAWTLRTNHDDESPFAHVVDVMPEVEGFFRRSGQSDHGSLELGQVAVFRSAWIEAMQALLPVKNVDVFSIDSGLQQSFDGHPRLPGIGDGADDPIRWIRDEITYLMRHVSLCCEPTAVSNRRRCNVRAARHPAAFK
jgi:hypothetical protein